MSHRSIEGVTTVIAAGPRSERWDLVIVGDGFRREDLPVYETAVATIVATILASPPFDELGAAINVHRVDVISEESGAGNLLSGTTRRTFFESTFGAHGLDRLLVTNETLALSAAIEAVPEMNATLMIVNSETYGGSGGAVPVFSRAADAWRIALHEMGHAHFGLADEYAYYSDCTDPARAEYSGPEPVQPNVTSTINPLKWGGGPAVMLNPDPNECNPAPSPFPAGAVGAFEGAQYFRRGKYRPSFACMMRDLADPFCTVCRGAIRRVLKPYMPSGARRRWSARH